MSKSNLLKELIGRTLTKVYITEQSEPEVLAEGLGYAYYFNVIMELDAKDKFVLGIQNIIPWTDNKNLKEVTHENWNVPDDLIFINRQIKDLPFNRYEQIYIRLDNDVILEFRCDYGCSLEIEKYDNVYDASGRAKWDDDETIL